MSILRDHFESIIQDSADEGVEREDWEEALDIVYPVPTHPERTSITAAKVNPESITLEWVCNNDDEHTGADDQVIVYGNLADVPEVGGAICPQCGEDMELISAQVEGVTFPAYAAAGA